MDTPPILAKIVDLRRKTNETNDNVLGDWIGVRFVVHGVTRGTYDLVAKFSIFVPRGRLFFGFVTAASTAKICRCGGTLARPRTHRFSAAVGGG